MIDLFLFLSLFVSQVVKIKIIISNKKIMESLKKYILYFRLKKFINYFNEKDLLNNDENII